jgi:hypothetical protein
MVQCIFGHVGSISRHFVDSNRALSNLHGKWFGFSHVYGPTPIARRSFRDFALIEIAAIYPAC